MLRLQQCDFLTSYAPGKESLLIGFDPDYLREKSNGIRALGQEPLKLAYCQKSDPTMNAVMRVITNGMEITMLLSHKDRISLNTCETLTWRRNDGRWLAVVPECLRHQNTKEYY
ncbi:unnamed protein product [Trichobilharzia regenti]|nr:unnamed protein product [Trichobilharzia regenti]